MNGSGRIGVAEVGTAIIERLDAVNRVRDDVLQLSRFAVRAASQSIRALHRGEIDAAGEQLDECGRLVGEMLTLVDQTPSIRWTGYVQDAMKEYAEASTLRSIVEGSPMPAPGDLGVEDAPYLNGLAEAASELRRGVLDALRAGDSAQAERYLEAMDDVYAFLVTVDFPDGLTGGLRRSTDALRAVVERTRGDLTLMRSQRELEQALQRAMVELASQR